MATSDSKVVDLKSSPSDPKRLEKLLYEIGSALSSVKRLASQGTTLGNGEALLAGIESLAAQAGYLTDTALRITCDEPGIVGDYEDWLRLHN